MIAATLRSTLFLLACLAGAASAGSFQVSPVRIDLSAARPTAVLRVLNSGTQEVTVQADIRAWSFSGEEDVFGETDAVLLNPPIFTLAPGATQFVRLGLRKRDALAAEASYRLFLEELPPSIVPEGIGVQTLLRLSIPAFVAPPGGKAAPSVQWRVAPSGAQAIVLTATNAGNAHIHIRDISVQPQAGAAVTSKNLTGYILPGQTRRWTIPGAALARATQLELTARSDAGDLRQLLAPGR